MDEDTLTALMVSHLLNALQLAVGAATLVDLPQQSTLERLTRLKEAIADLEISTVMLLNRTGVTWEQMADTLGVKRQSLNRRLTRKVIQREGTRLDISRLETEWQTWFTRLRDEVEETGNMKPRQIARRRAHRIVSHDAVPEVFG
jgi:hypothetical protein